MPTHVALLRGINVGGRNRVAMADLRQVVGATLFLHTPGGLGRSELAAQLTPTRRLPDRRDGWHRPQLGNREQAAGSM